MTQKIAASPKIEVWVIKHNISKNQTPTPCVRKDIEILLHGSVVKKCLLSVGCLYSSSNQAFEQTGEFKSGLTAIFFNSIQ